ncbi:hypothetical protein CYLTODRAFT_348560, partial [Cylindrobasidium torrendii FP15055 ss-10]
GGEDSSKDITRRIFAGEIGVPRLIKLLIEETTWFIPGHSLETFPDEMAAVRIAGHEIGLHAALQDNTHENLKEMTVSQQTEVLNHTLELLTDFCGKPPVGSVAPWWEVSDCVACDLCLHAHLSFEIILTETQAHDSLPFYCRNKDAWTSINYSAKSAPERMKPLERAEQKFCANPRELVYALLSCHTV